MTDPARIRRRLLDWFVAAARPLPWRRSRSPYRVWISEVMLQQTQIQTVIPYYQRFTRAFPTVQALAAAPLERVLEHWSGLGYYGRARRLHQAAQAVARDFGGRIPRDYRQLRTLPGVGDYTARAILSIAFSRPFILIDGNVERVVARLFALRGNAASRSFRNSIERELDRLLSRRRPGQFNQALMEIGQTICLPRAPRCDQCPLRNSCLARRTGDPERFPAPRRRRPSERHSLAVAAIQRQSKILMVRGLDGNLLSDLWNFPAAFGATDRAARKKLEITVATMLGGKPLLERLSAFRHTITYRSIFGTVYRAEAPTITKSKTGRWFALKDLDAAAISQLSRKVVALIAPVRTRASPD